MARRDLPRRAQHQAMVRRSADSGLCRLDMAVVGPPAWATPVRSPAVNSGIAYELTSARLAKRYFDKNRAVSSARMKSSQLVGFS